MSKLSCALAIATTIVATPFLSFAQDADLTALGEQTYFTYCAACHSVENRPPLFAESLKEEIPDLTGIAKRNGGHFPDQDVAETIRNGGISGHGTMRLLSWEKYFRKELSEKEAEQLVLALTAYLRTHQEK